MRYFEDFRVGDQWELGKRALTREEIVGFAREWDPQAFHTGERESVFGASVIASGVQIAGLWMRLFVDAVLRDTAVVGGKSFTARMHVPLEPGMAVAGTAEITEVEDSGRQDRGVVTLRGALHADDGTLVWDQTCETVVARQPVEAVVSAPDPQRFAFAAPALTESQEEALWDLEGEVTVVAIADGQVSVEYTGSGDAEAVVAALSDAVPGLALTPAR